MKIEYVFEKGIAEEIEVDEVFGSAYKNYLREERKKYWRKKKEKQRAEIKDEISLEFLIEFGIDFPSFSDPLDILINQEEKENSCPPVFNILTTYQKRVLFKFYVERKSKTQIAKEEKVSVTAIYKIIVKSTQKIAKFFS